MLARIFLKNQNQKEWTVCPIDRIAVVTKCSDIWSILLLSSVKQSKLYKQTGSEMALWLAPMDAILRGYKCFFMLNSAEHVI